MRFRGVGDLAACKPRKAKAASALAPSCAGLGPTLHSALCSLLGANVRNLAEMLLGEARQPAWKRKRLFAVQVHQE